MTHSVNTITVGADLEGAHPAHAPLFALICKTKKINMRSPVQPDNLYCCAPKFNIFWIRACTEFSKFWVVIDNGNVEVPDLVCCDQLHNYVDCEGAGAN